MNETSLCKLFFIFIFIVGCDSDNRPPPRQCISDLYKLTDKTTSVGVNFIVFSNDPNEIKTPSPPQGHIIGRDKTKSFGYLCPKEDGEDYNFSTCHANLMVDDFNRQFGALECNRINFYLNDLSVVYDLNYYDNDDPHASLKSLKNSSYNKQGFLNIFMVNKATGVLGTTYLHQMLSTGAVMILVVDSPRSSEVHVHETGHVLGVEHVAGSWPPVERVFRGCGEEIRYETISYPNCNYNHEGAWYASHCPLAPYPNLDTWEHGLAIRKILNCWADEQDQGL